MIWTLRPSLSINWPNEVTSVLSGADSSIDARLFTASMIRSRNGSAHSGNGDWSSQSGNEKRKKTVLVDMALYLVIR
jgi:hypothetical protein